MNPDQQQENQIGLEPGSASAAGTIVQVLAPGTVANLVCGFDILGMCLNEPNDLMEIKLLDEKKIVILSGDGYPLPLDPAQNTAGARLFEILSQPRGNTGFEEH